MWSTDSQLQSWCFLVACDTVPSRGLQVWKLSDYVTVPETLGEFVKISAIPSENRRWHGTQKEARASSTAFSRFKNGLAAEVSNRMDSLGSTMAADLGALEMERQGIPATKSISSLQQLCSRYSRDSKLLGMRKKSR